MYPLEYYRTILCIISKNIEQCTDGATNTTTTIFANHYMTSICTYFFLLSTKEAFTDIIEYKTIRV